MHGDTKEIEKQKQQKEGVNCNGDSNLLQY